MIACAACKVIINNMFRNATKTADVARRISLEAIEDPTACDEELYELAAAEVEAILAVRQSAVTIALNRLAESTKRKADPRSTESADRWARLIKRLR